MITTEQYEELWSHIKEIKTGMLVNNDDGDLHGRPMHIVQDGFDGTLFFFTKRSSEKTDEMREDRDVCVAFSCPEKQTYVSCSGRCRIMRDQELINRFWNPFVAAWFPEGKDDPDIALLEIHVHKAELWDSDESKMKQLFEIAKANLTDELPDMGKNKKYA